MTADFALVKAWKGDRWGNLVYRKTARNFNPMMATAGKITIAEVEHLVEPGEIDPDTGAHAQRLRAAHLPGNGLREAHRAADSAEGIGNGCYHGDTERTEKNELKNSVLTPRLR